MVLNNLLDKYGHSLSEDKPHEPHDSSEYRPTLLRIAVRTTQVTGRHVGGDRSFRMPMLHRSRDR